MDMGKKCKSRDVFSFFLFEETGDSEAGLGDDDDPGNKHVIPVDDEDGNNDDNSKKDIEDEDDDAGSCCYDSSNSGSDNNPHEDDEDDEFDGCDCDAENDGEALYDEGNVRKQLKIRHDKWENELYSDTASSAELSSGYLKKSSLCVSVLDTAKEPLTEAEKNRRFWEACLAS